jgi:hypothetical protein
MSPHEYDYSDNTGLDLTTAERTVVNAAHEALVTLKKTFEHWISIGRGLQSLRAKADRMGGRFTFDNLRERAGLGGAMLDKTMVSKLFRVMDELPAVTAWRQQLSEKQQFDWASPGAILKHCPVFQKEKPDASAEKPLTVAEKKDAEIGALKKQLAELLAERDVERYAPSENAEAMFGDIMRRLAYQTNGKAKTVLQAALNLVASREIEAKVGSAPIPPLKDVRPPQREPKQQKGKTR